MKYSLLATEGPHDQAAITRLLELSGLEKYKGSAKDLDPFWEGFIPHYPKGGNLYTRMDMPTILTSRTHSIAVYWGEGSKLVSNLNAIMTNHSKYAREVHAFGLVVDADENQPHKVAEKKAKDLRNHFPSLSGKPGEVVQGLPRTGIYVLPDNKRLGVLDSILVECASVVYPDHKKGALQFLNDLDRTHTQHLNAASRDKAIVACIVSVLLPGATNTASIIKNEWISEKTTTNNEVTLLNQFLKDLLELSFPK